MSRALLAAIALALAPAPLLAAEPAPPPTLKDLKRAEPPEIRAGETVAPDPERAKELYRRFLDLEGGDPALRTEAMRRLGDLQIEAGDSARGETAGQGEAETREAIDIYTRLLEQEPAYPRADVVLYQLARGWESLGDPDKALGYLDRLVAKYPGSARLDEAQFRRGEILFSARRYAEAQSAYEAASAFGAKSEFYEQSLYKLGWSHFKQSENEASFDPFVRVLDLKLVDPAKPGGVADPSALPRADRELVQDTFRVLSIGFSYVDGQETLDDFVAARGEIPYGYMLYSELGDLYVSKQRFTDAADSYRAFVDRYPSHERAPLLQMQAIEAYRKGGFAQLVLDGKKEFVERYRLGSPFWAGRTPDQYPLVARELKANLTDLAQYYHAEAQRSKKKPDYLEAARWYREFLQSFPDDPESAKTNYLLAETLFESEDFRAAAIEYERTAYAYPFHEKSAEAGYAALVCYERESKAMHAGAAAAWGRQRLESQQRFAVTFPAHPESAALLTRTAREYYDLEDLPKALEVAGLVLARQPPVDAAMQRTAWTVTGNAQFDTGRYADAEGAYLQVQSLLAPQDPEAAAIGERLAASIYKQGEAKQAAGDAAGAVDDFLRVGQLAPGSSIRETAEFDAGALLVSLKDWPRAIPVLESFRAGFPASPRQADVTRNLALAYLEGGRTGEAAGEFERIASSAAETPELQRSALWQAAELYEKSSQPARAMSAYESYVSRFPAPLAEAVEARLKLADHAKEAGDYLGRRKWLEAIVAADLDARGARTDRSRYLAAVAMLELTAASRDAFQSIPLVAPLEESLASKKSAMERALAGYQQAAGYAVAEVTTAATFEMGELYRRLAQDLLKSERPANLDADSLEQYDLLLEEQAFPFEEKAVEVHEVNARRAAEGLYDESVRKSYAVLAEIQPARFGKKAEAEPFVAVLEPPATTVAPETQQKFSDALVKLEAGDFAGARPVLEQLVAAEPGLAAPAVNLGMLHARESRWLEAEASLQEGLRRDPASAVALNELAAVQRENGRFQDAEATFRQALTADPGHSRTHRNFAVLLDLYLWRPAEALQHFETYVSMSGTADRQVSGWIAELKRRVGEVAQTAGVLP
ncbi:MAG TPA: tetratricopeptide repeat protein [Steroidobacteraceae bacterium]|nr:tetratricopeptide repeat protein [Steroidobacteraceae bacterium]